MFEKGQSHTQYRRSRQEQSEQRLQEQAEQHQKFHCRQSCPADVEHERPPRRPWKKLREPGEGVETEASWKTASSKTPSDYAPKNQVVVCKTARAVMLQTHTGGDIPVECVWALH